ncbi:MAG TPA: flagellar hook capping FlgD N-terminal domain-containing protein, partial [Phycisphaerales bacterium]|nr:flagellar hook capping FlgD N-terminal domain-containing protein [Phycisphaerales bacterium]
MPTAVTSLGSNSSTSGATPNRLSELSSEQFLKIIFTELQQQDPLQPNDSSKLLEQLSSIRSIQSDIELSDQLKSIVTQNQLASAGTMIGNYVSGLSIDNQRVIGQVVSVSRTSEGPVLNLHNGYRVKLDNIDEMTLPPLPSTPNN